MDRTTDDNPARFDRRQGPISTRDLLLSLKGRISQAQFWKGLLLLIAIVAFAIIGPALVLQKDAEVFEAHKARVIVYLVVLITGAFYSYLALTVRRLRDMNKSGYYLLSLFVPALGALFLLGLCGFGAGDVGKNRYGMPPNNR